MIVKLNPQYTLESILDDDDNLTVLIKNGKIISLIACEAITSILLTRYQTITICFGDSDYFQTCIFDIENDMLLLVDNSTNNIFQEYTLTCEEK